MSDSAIGTQIAHAKDNHMAVDQLLEAIAARGVVMYGAGYVAHVFAEALRKRGLDVAVRACVVTQPPEQPTELAGVPVESLDAWVERTQFDGEGPLVCLCVHCVLEDELRQQCEARGIQNAVWIYPLIEELAYGKPVRFGVSLATKRLLAAQPADWHWIAARAAGISDQMFGATPIADSDADVNEGPSRAGTSVGESAYVKCLALHCGRKTAEQRLRALQNLAQSMAEQGFDEAHPVTIDANLRIIDGLHRVALAWRLGIEEISCDIVRSSDAYDALLTADNKLDAAALERAGLTEEERAVVDRLQHELRTNAADPEISIVLPVYNVAEYIDQCMRSIVAQTFTSFEALLINDGSTDDSLAVCREWEARDERIRVIDKPNGGVSSARNRGIDEARGYYLAFVDPDDWLDERYLEILHARALETGADFVECDLWRYDNRTERKIHRFCGQRMGVVYTLPEHMKYGPTASYKSLSERRLWTDNDVRFPSCSFESPAIYALVLALAKHVEYIPEPLYFYRRFRENSLVETGYASKDGTPDNTLGVDALAYLSERFEHYGLAERYKDELPGIAIWRLNDILAMQYHRKTPENFAELVANQRAFVRTTFPQVQNEPYFVWGGYNLSKVCTHMAMLHDPSCRFAFSSLISLLGPAEPTCTLSHKNRYRQMMLQREMNREFWDELDRKQPAFLVLDLLEERFDIIEWCGRFLTKSDAFDGAAGLEPDAYRVIDRFSEECSHLFEQSVTVLAQGIAEKAPELRVILVENYLCETVGNLETQTEFDDIAGIRKTNEMLANYYDVVERLVPHVVRVDPQQCGCYFTDEHYEYGAIPSHLNEIANQRIAALIERTMQ